MKDIIEKLKKYESEEKKLKELLSEELPPVFDNIYSLYILNIIKEIEESKILFSTLDCHRQTARKILELSIAETIGKNIRVVDGHQDSDFYYRYTNIRLDIYNNIIIENFNLGIILPIDEDIITSFKNIEWITLIKNIEKNYDIVIKKEVDKKVKEMKEQIQKLEEILHS